ncbi:MAG: class I SAM-dependent methyltransferase [Candidatus Sulfotelmatobacter sp.]
MDKLRAVLPTPVKKCVWDLKYAVLGYPRFVAPEDIVRYLSARAPEFSSLLDLGCGRGSLLRALREEGWQGNYCGVDISKRAIEDARNISDQRSSWVVSDFESFNSPFHWDVIVMVESICYVKVREIEGFLSRLTGMMTDNGTLLFRLHDLEKHRIYVDAVLGLYPRTQKVSQSLFCIRHPSAAAVSKAS